MGATPDWGSVHPIAAYYSFIYIAPIAQVVLSKRSGMNHTVLLQITPCLPFPRKRSLYGATPDSSSVIQWQLTTRLLIPNEMKGWAGLVAWPIADVLPTLMVNRQLQVEHRTRKVRRPKTDVPPLCQATNHISILIALHCSVLQKQTWNTSWNNNKMWEMMI